ncbi:MAG: rod shape-determining protein MreC [Acutalibacteraceae bacterium]|nr:rod shape-determining protein MreC [Acutalibacteraceae bacterium]
MRFFFRSKKFKVMLGITCAVIVLALLTGIVGNAFSPQNGVLGAVTSSVTEFLKNCTDSIDSFFEKFEDNGKLTEENSSLKKQINELTSDLMDFEKAKQENEMYEKYYGIKEKNPDYIMEPAMLISRNADDPYYSFNINKGSLQGIALHDPVITEEGLVGYISEVNPSFSKVTTILDTAISLGGVDRRTRDSGVISGELSLAEEGKTRINNLLRSSGVATGDYIVTSGGGVFPEGLVIGRVDSVHNEAYNTALYGIVTPIVDFGELRDVMVITYFSGQGTISGE